MLGPWPLTQPGRLQDVERSLPAESGFFYAKQSRSALTNCDKPMQNLDQSKKNRWRVQCSQRQHLHQTRPQTTEMWKFGGTTSTVCPTCGSKTLSFLHWKCLGLDLSCSLEGCRMLRKLPAESGFFYAKQSRSALTNCDKPMQNLDQSKKNRWRVQCSQRQHLHQTRPQTTEMWKFGGTTSSMCRTCGSKSNVKFLHVKAKPIWLNCFCSCFFHLLSLSCCRPCTVQNTHEGCDILEIQSRFSQKRFSPGFVHPAMFNPRHSASMPNGQTSRSVSLPLVRLMSYDSYIVNCVFDPFKLHSMRIHRIAANGIHWAQSRNASALSHTRDEMLPEGSNRLESSRLFLEPNWENCE